MTRWTDLALRRPAMIALAALGVLLAGSWFAQGLDRELMPDMGVSALTDAPPTVRVSIRPDRGGPELAALQRLVEDEVIPELEGVAGVGNATLIGGRAEKLYLDIDVDRMAEDGVTVEDIGQALGGAEVALPAGAMAAGGRSIRIEVVQDLPTSDDRDQATAGPAAAGRGPSTPTATGPTPPGGMVAAEPGFLVVAVGAGDTLAGLSDRFGVDVEALRQANGLAGDTLLAGSVLRVPLATGVGDRLPPVWRALGATRAGEITPGALERALRDTPALVSDLRPEQLLALAPEAARLLPLPLVSRQPADARAVLLARMAALPLAPPTSPRQEPGREAEQAAGAGSAGVPPPREAPGMAALDAVAGTARVQEPAGTIYRFNGEPSLGLLVETDRRASAALVAAAVRARIEALGARASFEGVVFDVAYEPGSFVEAVLSGTERDGLWGVALAALVLWICANFSARPALAAAVSLPLPLAAALVMMRALGIPLTPLTIAALAAAAGRAAADAGAVVDGIHHRLGSGDDRREAAVAGTRAVAPSITGSVLLAVAAFLPLGFAGDPVRAVTLPLALATGFVRLAGLAVALIVVPPLAARLLHRAGTPDGDRRRLLSIHDPAVSRAIDHPAATSIAVFALFAGSLGLFTTLDRSFLPPVVGPGITVSLALAPGTELATADRVAARIEALVAADDAVAAVETTVGRGAGPTGAQGALGGDGARARIVARLDGAIGEGLLADLLGTATDPDRVADRLRRDLSGLRDQAVESGLLAPDSPLTVTVRAGMEGESGGRPLDMQVLGDSDADVREAGARVLAALSDAAAWRDRGFDEVPLVDLASDVGAPQPVIMVGVDPVRAQRQGILPAQVAGALRLATTGLPLGEGGDGTRGPGARVEVVARAGAGAPASVAALRDFEVRGSAGAVRLTDIATVSERLEWPPIARVGGRRTARISGEVGVADVFGVLEAAEDIVAELDLAAARPEGAIRADLGPASRRQRDAIQELLAAVLLAVLVVYLVLATTSESLLLPLATLGGLPFAVSGALVALAITDRPLGLAGLVGLILLVGTVAGDGSLLIDGIRKHRQRGSPTREALVAGVRDSTRTITIAALATAAALAPLALGLTGGASVAAELATAVIGGVAASALILPLIVPATYSLFNSWMTRQGPGARGGGGNNPRSPSGGP